MKMSTWIKEDDSRTWLQKLFTKILKQGSVPQHVGFILDGNRRYAKGKNLESVEGHVKGFDKLAETLRWCLDFGITEVTVYVFSIENFKRPAEEVNGLMKLAKEKFQKLIDEEDKIMEEGVCIQIVGDWSLVPDDLRPLMAKAMVMTRHNARAKLNVAFAYTARNEITQGVKTLNVGVQEGDLLLDDISESLLGEAFQILPTKPLDLLVRTSGETRLSDFLLWQSADTILCFADVLWPDFTYWHLMSSIFQYQANTIQLKQLNLKKPCYGPDADAENRKHRFIAKYREEKWRLLQAEAAIVLVPAS